MSKHIDFANFTIVNAEEFGDGVILPVMRIDPNDSGEERPISCDMCIDNVAEYVVSANELGPGGHDVFYCQSCCANARTFARYTGDVWVPQN